MGWEIASILRCDQCGLGMETRQNMRAATTPSFPWKAKLGVNGLPDGWTAARGLIGCPKHPVSEIQLARDLKQVTRQVDRALGVAKRR